MEYAVVSFSRPRPVEMERSPDGFSTTTSHWSSNTSFNSLLLICNGIFGAKVRINLIIFASYMEGRQTIWDPLRKKEVARTPEEVVRQWCINVLATRLQVPLHMMMSEVSFRLGDKHFRADIIVYDRSAKPLVVVECKRPEVELTQEVLDQAIRYNMVLNVKYMIITNGTKTYMCGREGERYVFVTRFPVYSEMLG